MANSLISKVDDKMKKRCYEAMQRAEPDSVKTYLNEMHKIKAEEEKDGDVYSKKFGLLKKAAVLMFYRREKDAKYEIARAATIV